MNYRHGFHAGNFADVFKHVVLARVVEYLKRKDGPFRVVDTHAGAGRYDLSGEQAARTGEWRGGIGRLIEARPGPAVATLLAPYLDAVGAPNREGVLQTYPGSPLLVRNLLRRQDRLTAIELHPDEAERLKTLFAGDHQTRVIALDGWLALGAHLPPKERRGAVLIDPPFEAPDEFGRMLDGLVRAHRRWPGGTYLLWYPVKARRDVERFRESLTASGIADILDAGLAIRASSGTPRLDGCGMAIVNPPWVIEEELGILLPFLADTLGEDGQGAWTLERLAPERSGA